MSNHNIKLGDRVECEDHKGTVKYIGIVDGTTGDWIGVDWDQHNRGKHDGSVNGKKYFETSHPTSGSLVRAHKLIPRRSFVEAIKLKYIESNEISNELLPQPTGYDRAIEYVGFEKSSFSYISSFKRHTELSLINLQIAFCGEESHEFFQVFSRVETLNLTNNLFSSWNEVAKIISLFPSLTKLILSYNRITCPEQNSNLRNYFAKLNTLVIDNLNYDWNDVLKCATLLWPNIKRLDLWGNKITYLSEPESSVFSQLNYLSLSNNLICDWKEICKLGKLPNLQCLDIGNCGIKSIVILDASLFKQLKQLFLKDNQLSSWNDIAELNKLQKLEDLMIKRNPIFQSDEYEVCFNFVLSKIENLKVLNREQINQVKRKDSEIYYFKRFYKEYKQSKNDEFKLEQFLKEHPRFLQLISKFGELADDETASKSELNKKKYLNLIFKCPTISNQDIIKKIPASTTIANLKFSVKRMFKIDFKYQIELIWKSKEFECPLDKEDQCLNFYSIENDDTILVKLT